ncbi:hypothetical protein GPALN_012324 [Globodera pallida]|nr:hypothetical protein GPALN_012324 [Globodera pallida]
MPITKSTGRTPNLDKLNPIQMIRILLSQSLITLDKLNPIQLIRIHRSQSLITLDKLNPIQLIRILLSVDGQFVEENAAANIQEIHCFVPVDTVLPDLFTTLKLIEQICGPCPHSSLREHGLMVNRRRQRPSNDRDSGAIPPGIPAKNLCNC